MVGVALLSLHDVEEITNTPEKIPHAGEPPSIAVGWANLLDWTPRGVSNLPGISHALRDRMAGFTVIAETAPRVGYGMGTLGVIRKHFSRLSPPAWIDPPPLSSLAMTIQKPPDWRALVESKLAKQRKGLEPWLIPAERLPPVEREKNVLGFFDEDENWGLLTEQEREMTEESDAGVVLEKLRCGQWKCLDLVKGYIKRASIIHQLTNTLTEPIFTRALAQAAHLDSLPTGQRGPLYGLPVTLKDQFNVPGFDSTIGYVSNIGNSSKLVPSVVVQMLESLGAIVFAKTNLPQSIMWCETENNIFGRTDNPRDRTFTPGGSTGGEAVNLVMKGGLLGLGTDIGGSIRIPSALTGVYGLKPSSTRLPYQDVTVSTEGQEHVPSVIGPMARSISSMTTFMRAIISAEPWMFDPKVTPLPWRENIYQDALNKKLVIGVVRDDGVIRVHPPIRRVLDEAAKKLQAAGHEVVEWVPEGHAEAIAIMDEFYASDGGEDLTRAVTSSGEPFIPHVARLVKQGPPISVYEYWQLNKRKWASQKAYLDKWNASTTLTKSGEIVDLLLTPVMPHVAVPHKGCRWVGYTKIWNVLDYSAGVIPNVGFVDRSVDKRESYEPRGDADRWNWELYDPEMMHGHPVGLQVVGRRLQEEKVLAGMQVVEAVLRG